MVGAEQGRGQLRSLAGLRSNSGSLVTATKGFSPLRKIDVVSPTDSGEKPLWCPQRQGLKGQIGNQKQICGIRGIKSPVVLESWSVLPDFSYL